MMPRPRREAWGKDRRRMPLLHRPGKPSIHYVIDDHTDPWRDAPWLLLQHGYGRSTEFWRGWVPYLSRFYRVIRADLRGFGRSPFDFDPHACFAAEEFVDDIRAVIDAVAGGGPVHYCGESFAGVFGILLAATAPERLRSLTLLSTPMTIREETQRRFAFGHPTWQQALRAMGTRGWTEAANAASRFPPGADPGLLAWCTEEMSRTDVEVMIAFADMSVRTDAGPFLPRVRVPALGLYPSGGIITGVEERLIRDGIAGVRIVHLPTRYHAIQVLMPAACATTLLHFCGAVDGVPNRE
jgi:3-oxoadipate enol-lactonase